MLASLEQWIIEATRKLSSESRESVRREIQEHYELSREDALANSAGVEEAGRVALLALGSARTANREYRKTLVTSAEARVLREGNWEARAYCSRTGLKWALLALPVAALTTAAWFWRTGTVDLARMLLMGGIGMGLMLGGPLLPIYVPSRARVFRIVKWTVLIAMGFQLQPLLMASCLWVLFHIEWSRSSLRRKLPVARWPKHLYL